MAFTPGLTFPALPPSSGEYDNDAPPQEACIRHEMGHSTAGDPTAGGFAIRKAQINAAFRAAQVHLEEHIHAVEEGLPLENVFFSGRPPLEYWQENEQGRADRRWRFNAVLIRLWRWLTVLGQESARVYGQDRLREVKAMWSWRRLTRTLTGEGRPKHRQSERIDRSESLEKT